MVVGSDDDLHVQAVVAAADRRGVQPLRIDARRLAESAFAIDELGVRVSDEDGRMVRLGPGRGWLRRLAPEDWRDGDPAGYRGVIQEAWVTALLSVISLSETNWLSELDAVHAAEDKLVQQAVCSRLGVRSPPTALVTRRELIPLSLGQDLVVKPMAAGHYRDENGTAQVVHATAMSRDDLRLDLLSGAPFLVQRRIPVFEHLRILTVGKRAWAARLEAERFPLDWRSAEKAHTSWEPATRPNATDSALRIADALNVGYSSQDWLIDADGLAYFIDLNPSGQWLFLPPEVSMPATEAIVDWLIGAPG